MSLLSLKLRKEMRSVYPYTSTPVYISAMCEEQSGTHGFLAVTLNCCSIWSSSSLSMYEIAPAVDDVTSIRYAFVSLNCDVITFTVGCVSKNESSLPVASPSGSFLAGLGVTSVSVD